MTSMLKVSKSSPPPYRAKSVRKAADLPSFDSKHILLSRPDLNHLSANVLASGSEEDGNRSSLDSLSRRMDNNSLLDTIVQELECDMESSPPIEKLKLSSLSKQSMSSTTSSSSGLEATLSPQQTTWKLRGSRKGNLSTSATGADDKTRAKGEHRLSRDSREFVCVKIDKKSKKPSERERRTSLMSMDLSFSQAKALEEATVSYYSILSKLRGSIPPVVFNRALGIVVGKILGASVIAGMAKGSGTFIRRTQGKWSPPVFLDISYKTLGFGGVRGEFVALLMSEASVHELYKTGNTALHVDIKAGAGIRPSTTTYSRTPEAIVYGRHTGFSFGLAATPLNIALKAESLHQGLYGAHVTTRTLLKRAWPMGQDLPLIKLANDFDHNSQVPGWS